MSVLLLAINRMQYLSQKKGFYWVFGKKEVSDMRTWLFAKPLFNLSSPLMKVGWGGQVQNWGLLSLLFRLVLNLWIISTPQIRERLPVQQYFRTRATSCN